MRSGIFGWSYPPGAANDPNAPYNQTDDGPCAVCALSVDDCVCPTCVVCHANGDPKCYAAKDGHSMKLNRAQVLSRQSARIANLEQTLADEKLHLEVLQDEAHAFSSSIEDYPDPWR